jgi:hypothetical protein
MRKKVKNIWKSKRPSFKPTPSRWGIFTALLALSAVFIAIGGWTNMNIPVYIGFGLLALAIGVAIYWLIKPTRDDPATKKDVDNLANKIKSELKDIKKSTDNLADEIRKDRESRNITKK